ncbi:MAG: DUF3108 domain-containing protein [Syntrophobacteraceae bacterium]
MDVCFILTMKKLRTLAFIILALLTMPFAASSKGMETQRVKPPFRPGEKLSFKVMWQFIPAAAATLEVLPEKVLNGVRANHFRLTIKTNSLLDKIYKVRNRVDAYTDADMTHSLLYTKKQEEGRRKRDVTVTFDWEKGEAQYKNFNKKSKPIALKTNAFDPLSLFYAFRLEKLTENAMLQTPLCDGKKCISGKARVLGRQEIQVESGTFDTYLVEPDLRDVSGVFSKSKDARMLIWVTADERHLPVKITSTVAVGSFIAELISIENSSPQP